MRLRFWSSGSRVFEGAIGGVPVYNVSIPVMNRDFWVLELSELDRAAPPVH